MPNKLVVADPGWAETIPEWILEEIKTERIVYGMADILKGTKTIGDAEVLAYLYTLCLVQPLDEQTHRIYLYLSTKLMTKRGIELPEDIRLEEIDNYDKYELNRLKQEIYTRRGGSIDTPLLNVLRGFKRGRK